MLDKASQARLNHRALAIGIYRSILLLAAMVAILKAFPDHGGALALGLIFIAQAIHCSMVLQETLANALDTRSELSDRKTRHAVLLAATHIGDPDHLEGWSFWSDVNQRVNDEIGDNTQEPDFWRSAWAVAWRIGGHALSDILMFGLAAFLAG